MLGSYGAEPEEVVTCLNPIAAGRLQLAALLGDTIPLAAVPDGLKRVRDGEAGGSRLLVDPRMS